MLRTGAIEWEIPTMDPPFHFGTMATQVRMAGYFMSDNLYIRHEELIGMAIDGGQRPLIKPHGQALQ
jgi:hypothetical protein